MALEITRGLFGLEVPESSDQDFKDAVTFAQLSPEQSVRASGMMSGQMLGRGIGQGLTAIAGAATGVDVRDNDIKRKAAGLKALQQIKEARINPEDPEAYLPIVIRAFQDEGLTEDALKAATSYQSFKMNKLKTQAEVESKMAEAAKDRAEVSSKKTGWLQNGIANGILDPKSVSKFLETGNLEDLKFRGKYNQSADVVGADGKPYRIAYSADDPSDFILMGEVEPKHTDPNRGLANKTAKMNALLTSFGYVPGGDVRAVLDRMKKTDSAKWNEYVALAKETAGADNLDLVLNTGVYKVTEEERKAMLQGEAGVRAAIDFRKIWEGKPPPISRAEFESILSEMKEIAPMPNDVGAMSVLENFLIRKFENPMVRNYVVALMRMAYPRLRLETGAAISGVEWANSLRGIVPYKEDDEQTRAIKVGKAFDDIKGVYSVSTTTSKAANEYFSILFPEQDVVFKAMSNKFSFGDNGTKPEGKKDKPNGDIVSRAKQASDAGMWRDFYKKLTPAEIQELKDRGVIK